MIKQLLRSAMLVLCSAGSAHAAACRTAEDLAADSSVAAEQTDQPAEWGLGFDPADLTLSAPTPRVRWPAGCVTSILFGGEMVLVAPDGRGVALRSRRVGFGLAVDSDIGRRPDPGEGHRLRGYRFIQSVGPITGTMWSLGLWTRRGGSLIALFRPGDRIPRSLLRSAVPIQAMSYLGAPDARGGRLQVLQRPGPGDARVLAFDYAERGLYPPDSKP